MEMNLGNLPHKCNTLRDILNDTTDLNDTQAIIMFGLAYEAGEKFFASRAYQKRFGTGLRESKEAIERWCENNQPPS